MTNPGIDTINEIPWETISDVGVAVFISVVVVVLMLIGGFAFIVFMFRNFVKNSKADQEFISQSQNQQAKLISSMFDSIQGNRNDSFHELIKIVENQTLNLNRAFNRIDNSYEKFASNSELMYQSFNELIKQNKSLLDKLESFIEEEKKYNDKKCNC